MILTKSKSHAIAFGLLSCALGAVAIMLGDHHAEFPFQCLVALGVALTLAGLFLLRFSWSIRGASSNR